jgi:hypothetical protein
MASQGFGGGGGGVASQQQAGAAGSGAPAPPRQRVRARRGQATDPHSIAERVSHHAYAAVLLLSLLTVPCVCDQSRRLVIVVNWANKSAGAVANQRPFGLDCSGSQADTTPLSVSSSSYSSSPAMDIYRFSSN